MTVAQTQTDACTSTKRPPFLYSWIYKGPPSPLSIYLRVCTCIRMARREKSPSIGGRRRCRSVDYVGEKKGERIRILFVGGSFLLSRNQVTVALFISFLFPFFFRQCGHCPWLNGREKGQKRFIEIRRSEVERRQKPLFVKPLLAARRFLFAVFWPLVANLSPASRCTHTITLPPHSFTMRAYDRFSKSIVREWSFNEVSRARDSRLVQN